MASPDVASDDRGCPWCPEPLTRADAAAVLVPDAGGVDWRWAHKKCARWASKKANKDRVMYPKYSACLRCGGTMADGSHTVGNGPARCGDDEDWISPTREDHAERRVAWLAAHPVA